MLHYLINIIFTLGSRTNKRHITSHNVPQLWKFVEMMFTQKAPYFSHTSVAFMLIKCRTILFCINTHTPELIYTERSAETPYALLPKYCRATILTAHGNITYQEERSEQYQCHQRCHEVEHTLNGTLQLVHSIEYIIIFLHFFYQPKD